MANGDHHEGPVDCPLKNGGDRRGSRQKVRIPTPWGAFEAEGLSVILGTMMVLLMLTASALIFIAYTIYHHDKNLLSLAEGVNQSNKQVAKAFNHVAVAQREFSCLSTKSKEEARESWRTGECRAAARIGVIVNGE